MLAMVHVGDAQSETKREPRDGRAILTTSERATVTEGAELHKRLMRTDPEYRAAYAKTIAGQYEDLQRAWRQLGRSLLTALPSPIRRRLER